MTVYSLEEANYLIGYFSNKMIGKTMQASIPATITHLDREPLGNNKYQVVVFGKVIKQIFYSKRSLDLVAKDLNLLSPEEVLKGRS
jgi:hypothetical protein